MEREVVRGEKEEGKREREKKKEEEGNEMRHS